MNCTTVRDRLAEHTLGALTQRDAQPVDRHLAWCAACRKEAGELQQASATLAFTLVPDDPPGELADRVVAARSDRLVRLETIRSQSAVERFRDLLNTAEFGDPQDEVFLGTLSPASAGGGGGSALTLVSPSIIDMAIVLVNGVPEETRELLPFTVRLRGDDGVLMVGRIEKGALDDSGAGIVMREFDELIGYDSVIVRDVNGDVVLSGSMQTRAAVTSPSP